MTRVFAALGLLSMLLCALLIPEWTAWNSVWAAVVPAAGALLVRRVSLLVCLYLTEISVFFGLTGLLLERERHSAMLALVLVWACGMALGALAAQGKPRAERDVRRAAPQWPHFRLSAAMIVVQAYLVLTGQMGVGAQLTVGLSTPTGLAGILATASPVVNLMLLVSALGTKRRVPEAVALTVLQATVLSLSGFRAAAVIFLLAVVPVVMLSLPKESPWRQPRRLALAATAIAFVAVAGFIGGAVVKDRMANEVGLASAGTRLFGWDQAVPEVAGRLDLGSSLQRALDVKDDTTVHEAVSWTSQILAFVPRALWPEKPILNYGQRVSVAVENGHAWSSSTVTTVGDTLINFGLPGVVLVSFGLGLGVTRAERWVRGGGVISLALAAALSTMLVGQTGHEAALVLGVAGLVRDTLVASCLWIGCQMLSGQPDVGSDRLALAEQR